MLNATLVKRINITSDLMIIRVLPDAGVGNFNPGQYVALGLPGSATRPTGFPPENEEHAPDKLIKRAYSLGSAPSQKEYLEFYIAIVPTGALTSRLAVLKEGDRLFAAPKIIGTFTLTEVAPEKNLVLVSTGTGIAPFMSMIRTPSTWTQGRRITIAHGVRFERDLAYRDEILNLKENNPSLDYFAFVSREDAKPGFFEKGYVQSFLLSGAVPVEPSRDHVFLCGNPGMIDDVEKLLLNRGYTVHSKKSPEGSLHHEKYW